MVRASVFRYMVNGYKSKSPRFWQGLLNQIINQIINQKTQNP